MNQAMSHLTNKLVLQGIHITGFWNKEVISQKEKKKESSLEESKSSGETASH